MRSPQGPISGLLYDIRRLAGKVRRRVKQPKPPMPRVTEGDLRAGDVLLTRVGGYGILYPLVRWLITWGHAFIYFTETRRGLPLVIESIGRGVLIRSLYCYAGTTVRVMRPRIDTFIGEKAAKEAEHLSDNPQSFYGYLDIPRYVVPKLVLRKLARWLPGTWRLSRWILARTYRRNSVYICSELVAAAFRNAGYPVTRGDTIPLPDDLAKSDCLMLMGEMEVRRCLDSQ